MNQQAPENYSSPLHEFIAKWIATHDTTWQRLFTQATIANAVSTQVRRGSTPRPGTRRKLADAMGVPRRKLFEVAGYVRPEELEPEDIEITDPEIALFFLGYEWDEFTEAGQDIIRQAVRSALAIRREREAKQEKPDANNAGDLSQT